MNIRLSPEEVRVRVSEEELAALGKTGRLSQTLTLTERSLHLVLETAGIPGLTVTPDGITVVCAAEDGYTFTVPGTETKVLLEVDLFSRSRR